MTDYIDRQAAIEAVEFGITHTKAFRTDGTVVELFAVPNEELKKAMDRIAQLPSVEVEPVKRGRVEWRREKTIWQTGYYCSECQAFFGKDYDMVKYFNYCPNCGAKVEIEDV